MIRGSQTQTILRSKGGERLDYSLFGVPLGIAIIDSRCTAGFHSPSAGGIDYSKSF